MDILEFYGLKEDPFKLTPDPMFFFSSVNHNEALLSLNYVVQQREGFCLVTGEPGTGKTTILNVFKENWKDNAEIALILTPRLSPEEFLLSVLEDLNIKVTMTNKNELLRAFRDFLLEKSRMGKPMIIIVDEAQNLPDETLEELRLLSNLETYKDKLLQIILIGQPELERRLNENHLKQLNQRITVRARLSPLSSSETMEYINYRLIKAGKGFLRLDENLPKPVYKFTAGIPRLINILSSRAIMSAYLDGSNVVTKRHVNYAIRHLKDNATDRMAKGHPRLMYILPLIISFVVAGVIGYYYSTWHKDGGIQPGPPVLPVVQESVEDKKPEQLLQKQENEVSSRSSPASSGQVEIKKTQRFAVVNVMAANIRVNPAITASKIGMAYKGEKIEIIDESMDSSGSKWYKISVFGNREGWIADEIVTLLTP